MEGSTSGEKRQQLLLFSLPSSCYLSRWTLLQITSIASVVTFQNKPIVPFQYLIAAQLHSQAADGAPLVVVPFISEVQFDGWTFRFDLH